jgi:pimeloyl-ACP methyl ester carboxylesterase
LTLLEAHALLRQTIILEAAMQAETPETTRRRILAMGGAGAAAFATPAMAEKQAPPKPQTFVLVHGSWHGGWCYSRVASLLRAQGHHVFTPTLTGLADRSHLVSDSVNLDTHIADIVNLIDWYDLKDIVLCGHSFGGMPVTGAADRRSDRIASLVFLDAFVPNNGQSLVDVAHQPMPTTPTQPSPPAERFVHTKADIPWVQSKLTAHPNGTRTQKIALSGAWLGIAKKTYIRVPEFTSEAFDGAFARFAADPKWKTDHILGSGHDAMVDQPEKLAAMLQA